MTVSLNTTVAGGSGGAMWTDQTGTALRRPDGSSTNISRLADALARNSDTGLQNAKWKGRQRGDPWAAPLIPIGTSSMNTFISTGASFVHSVDTVTTLAGRPSSKLVISGSPSSNALEAGISGAAHSLSPTAQELLTQTVSVAIKGTIVTASSPTVASCIVYVGDSTFANFYQLTLTNYADTADGWRIFSGSAAEAGVLGTTGSPSLSSAVRSKVRFTMSGGTWSVGDIYIGPISVSRAARPAVILTCDDGYDNWYSYLWPALIARGLVASLGIDSAYLNTTGYLTSAQIAEMMAEGSVEFTNHGYNNEAYSVVGLSTYMANLATTDALLEGIGVPLKSRRLHAYVGGSYDTTLIAAMQAEGYTSMREVGAANRPARQLLTGLISPSANSRHSRYSLAASANLQTGVSVATIISYIEEAKLFSGHLLLMGHQFLSSAGTLTYIAGYDPTYGMSNLLDYLASERDAGRIDVVKWSDWAASIDSGL